MSACETHASTGIQTRGQLRSRKPKPVDPVRSAEIEKGTTAHELYPAMHAVSNGTEAGVALTNSSVHNEAPFQRRSRHGHKSTDTKQDGQEQDIVEGHVPSLAGDLSFYKASDTSASEISAPAMSNARARLRPCKSSSVNFIRIEKINLLISEEETQEDGSPNGGIVSMTGDLVFIEDARELPSVTECSHGQLASYRLLPLDYSKSHWFGKYGRKVVIAARAMTRYMSKPVRSAVRIVRPLLAGVLTLWVFIIAAEYLIFPRTDKSAAFSCQLPLVSRLRLCQKPPVLRIPKINATMQAHHNYQKILEIVGKQGDLRFDNLTSDTRGAYRMRALIGKSETPSRDLLVSEYEEFDRDQGTAEDLLIDVRRKSTVATTLLRNLNEKLNEELQALRHKRSPSMWRNTVKFLNIFSCYQPPAARRLRAIFDEHLWVLDYSIEVIYVVFETTDQTVRVLNSLRDATTRINATSKDDEAIIRASKGVKGKKKWRGNSEQKAWILLVFQIQQDWLGRVNGQLDRVTGSLTEVRNQVGSVKASLNELKRQPEQPKGQDRWDEATEEVLRRHLTAWCTAVLHQWFQLELQLGNWRLRKKPDYQKINALLDESENARERRRVEERKRSLSEIPIVWDTLLREEEMKEHEEKRARLA